MRHDRCAYDLADDTMARLVREREAMRQALELCLDREDIADCELGDHIRAVLAGTSRDNLSQAPGATRAKPRPG